MTSIVGVPGRDDRWRVGDTEFVRSFAHESTRDRFCIRKGPTLVKLYQDLCASVRGGRIVELGVADGGSTALIALLAQPSKLVACELDASRRPALDEFIAHHGLSAVVRPIFGVDQGDRARLGEIARTEFGDDELDLVIDDASHLYDQTIASFEVLFPRLRVDGTYVIEDWAADYTFAEAIGRALDDPEHPRHQELVDRVARGLLDGSTTPRPLAQLAVELMLATTGSPDVIAEVGVNRHWVTVRRGPAPVDPASFRIARLYADHFGWLA